MSQHEEEHASRCPVKRVYQARRPAQRELDERVLRAVRSGKRSRQEVQDSSRTWFPAPSADARRIQIMRSLHRLEAAGAIEQVSKTRKPVIYRATGDAQKPIQPARSPDGAEGALSGLESLMGDPVYIWPPLKRRNSRR